MKTRIAAMALIAGVLGLAACGGVSSSSLPARVSTTSSAKMTMPQWWNNCGASEISGLNQDLGTVQQGINYGQDPVSDVQQLGSDAKADLTQEPLPPVDANSFTGWLNSLVQIAE